MQRSLIDLRWKTRVSVLLSGLLFCVNVALAAELVHQIDEYQLDLTGLPWVSFLIAGVLAGSCGLAWFLHRWAHGKIADAGAVRKLASHVGISVVAGLLAMSVQAWREAGPFEVIIAIIVAGLSPNPFLKRWE